MHSKVFVKLKKTLKPSRPGKKPKKKPKKPKKPKKNQKNPLGWVFFKKTRVFSKFQPCFLRLCMVEFIACSCMEIL